MRRCIATGLSSAMHPARLRCESLTYINMPVEDPVVFWGAFAPCRTGASTLKNVNLFLHGPSGA